MRVNLISGIIVVAVLLGCSCTPKRFGIAIYDQSLKLDLELPTTVVVGEVVRAHYLLRNASDSPVEACISQDSGYNVFGSELLGRGGVTDHQSCKQRFLLEPGEAYEWDDDLEIIASPMEGTVRISGWVKIVDPTRCGRYGCDWTAVSSDYVQVAARVTRE
jgi:hypothetical protein